MLTAEENEVLTRVGPGSPMGALMRRYWLPACTSADLEASDAPQAGAAARRGSRRLPHRRRDRRSRRRALPAPRRVAPARPEPRMRPRVRLPRLANGPRRPRAQHAGRARGLHVQGEVQARRLPCRGGRRHRLGVHGLGHAAAAPRTSTGSTCRPVTRCSCARSPAATGRRRSRARSTARTRPTCTTRAAASRATAPMSSASRPKAASSRTASTRPARSSARGTTAGRASRSRTPTTASSTRRSASR